jgi:hypothetical protein
MQSDDDFFVGQYGAGYESPPPPPYEPPPPHEEPHTAPVRATIWHERKPRAVRVSQLVPYIIAGIAVAVAIVALLTAMHLKTNTAAEMDTLRHQLAMVQQQAAAGDVQAQSAVSSVSRRVANVASRVNGVSATIGPFSGQCTVDASGPNGVSAYVFMCRR